MTSAAQIQAEISAGVVEIINLMGSNFTLTDKDGTAYTVRGCITSTNNSNVALVNSVGIESSVFYCLPQASLPRKLEKLNLGGGKTRVINAVHELIVNGTTVAIKMVLDA